jgi:hypothetical protein
MALVRMRSCVRPLTRDACPLAQMGSASDIQTTGRPIIATGINGFCLSSVRPIVISCLPLNPRQPRVSGCDRRTPIRFPTRHHGPDNPGCLVGQGHCGELARFALQQLQQPRRGGFVAWFGAHDGHGADEQ